MAKTRKLTIIIALVAVVAMFFGMTQSAFAKDANNMPVNINIPIKYKVKGDSSNCSAIFMLEPKNKNNPMPSGSKIGYKKLTLKHPCNTSFGAIMIEKPNVYEYTVTRITEGKSDFIRDKSRYNVKLIALNDGSTNVIVTRFGESKKTSLVYQDKRTAGSKHHGATGGVSRTAKTGDDFNPIIIGAIFLMSLAMMLYILSKSRRKSLESKA